MADTLIPWAPTQPLSWAADPAASGCILAVLLATAGANIVFCLPRCTAREKDAADASAATGDIDTRALSGLRGLAALHLALGHHLEVSPLRVNLMGGASMSCFYLLSGFALTLGYGKDLAPGGGKFGGAFNKWRFWRNRFARLFPMYLITNVLAVLVQQYWADESATKLENADVVLSLNLIFTALGLNMWLCPVDVWLPRSWWIPLPINPATWIVQTMAAFYMVFPCMLSWLKKVQRRGLTLHVLFWLQAVTFLSMDSIGIFWVNNDKWGYWSARAWPLGRIPVFAMGCLAAVERMHGGGNLAFCRCCPQRCSPKSDNCRWGMRATALGLSYLAILALGITLYRVPVENVSLELRLELICPILEAFVPLLFIDMILALTHCGNNGALAKLCRCKPMEWMGNIAMAFYMVHGFVLWPFSGFSGTIGWLPLGIGFLLSLLLGWLLAYFVEEPSRRCLRA